MKAEDIKGKTADELKKMLVDLKQQQMTLRFQKAGGQLSNTAQIRGLRRDIARIQTVLEQQKGGPTAAKAKSPKSAKKTKAA
ncbi:50S ribosomal protein L29 [Micavibrio aeruginosavorus]|uniref:Large ribosomal subunit protein uL29 n=2 Tax=Micavibrio aeruginosavorus TaxID=349221 RepID=G2KQV5_MICAA|nr:50S ribosomal protein L29 [Micavibrio aeruginosavorus]AEP10433.1 ribosomal protein L29 [Micavibrio aeruginosavorus ARL-13]AGH98849.1 LSU ribosomal protein L29p (L35e) [Micavibrio aeruginosavorus EPB]